MSYLFDDEPLMESTSGDIPTVLLHIEDPEENLPWDKLAATSQALIKGLRELGYHYLRLDRDGDVITGMPTFDW